MKRRIDIDKHEHFQQFPEMSCRLESTESRRAEMKFHTRASCTSFIHYSNYQFNRKTKKRQESWMLQPELKAC